MIDDRQAARQIIREVLAADLACSDEAFRAEGVTFVVSEDRPGRRRFPHWSKPLGIVSLGPGVVVSSAPERLDWLRPALGELARDAIFSAATIARLARHVEADGQELVGPQLKFACTLADLRPIEPPSGVEIELVDGANVADLYRHDGFRHALAYRVIPERPDILATVARRDGAIVGIAGATDECGRMWQIGIDVVGPARGQGIGRALVGRLTRAVLDRGRLAYYSTAVSNVASRGLAVAVGYWPAWVDMYARDLSPKAVAPPQSRAGGVAPTLTDGVVRLDGYTLDDVAAHLAGEDEEHARRFGWYPNRSTTETVRRFILKCQEDWRTGANTRAFAARDAATGALVGGCEIRLQGDAVAHMSWWTAPPYRGRGFASRAARLAGDYAFAALGAERLEAYVEIDNDGSRGVARKAGFTQEGILRRQGTISGARRDMVLYARLVSEGEGRT